MNGRLLLVVDFMLAQTKGDVVATVSTSRMLDDIGAKHGGCVPPVRRLRVGWVVEKMQAVNAVIGGEGTGGVIYPNIHWTTDGLASIAAIAQHLVESGGTVTQLVDSICRTTRCVERNWRFRHKSTQHAWWISR